MFKYFYPDRLVDSIYDIDFEALYKEGKRAVLFDIDNTLVEHDADSNEEVDRFFEKLHAIGFKTCLISNNDEERVTRFNKNIHTEYIYKAGKPLDSGYLAAIKKLGVTAEEALFVGDQLFTDIRGARNAKIDNICVKPVGPEKKPTIKMKRALEKPIFRSYNRYMRKMNLRKGM